MTLFQASLMTFVMAMVPVVELRGAIPAGTGAGLDPIVATIIAIVGNLVPVPFLILFTRRVFDWLKTMRIFRKLVEKLEARAEKKSQVVMKYAWIGLCILVAIPLPGTGAWTGALVAAMMDMRLKKAMPSITLGVVLAGIIVFFITYIWPVIWPYISMFFSQIGQLF